MYSIEDADIVILIEKGIPRVVKHRTLPVESIEAEVKLTYRPKPITEAYPPQPALNLASDAAVQAARDAAPTLTRRIAVSKQAIREMLEDAIRNNDEVKVSGTKADGEAYFDRAGRPRSIERGYNGELVTFYTTDGHRCFYLSGIDRAEIA